MAITPASTDRPQAKRLHAQRLQQRPSLGASRYDQVASGMLAVLLVLCSVTLLMFLIWLSQRIIFIAPAVPVTVLEDVGGGSTGSGPWTGGEGELQQPDANEVAGPVDTSVSIEQSIGAAAAVVQSRS